VTQIAHDLGLLLGGLLAARAVTLVLAAGWHAHGPATPSPSGDLPHLDVLVPAFNEEAVLKATVERLLRSDHPQFDVWILDDGSTDTTAQLAHKLASRDPRVHALILPHNVGKAAALNHGLGHLTGPHVATIDADTLVERSTLSRLTRRLLTPDVSAVAGNVKVGNRTSLLTRLQSLEYIASLQLNRRAQDTLGCITTIPGAAGAYTLDALQEVGGYSSDTRTEDTDLTLSLLRAGHHMVFEPNAHTYTEAPSSLSGMIRQRERWLTGFLQCLWKHRSGLGRPNAAGLLGLPNLLYTHVLTFLLPLPLLWSVDAYDLPARVLLGGISGFGVAMCAIAWWAIWADREDPRDAPWVPLQIVIWPTLLYVVAARVCLGFIRQEHNGWFRPEREGDLSAASLSSRADLSPVIRAAPAPHTEPHRVP
jgi:cellulose synthase/poly-beta-1,6-N-acetylglucosamine synthase-like glycosyltransferase